MKGRPRKRWRDDTKEDLKEIILWKGMIRGKIWGGFKKPKKSLEIAEYQGRDDMLSTHVLMAKSICIPVM